MDRRELFILRIYILYTFFLTTKRGCGEELVHLPTLVAVVLPICTSGLGPGGLANAKL